MRALHRQGSQREKEVYWRSHLGGTRVDENSANAACPPNINELFHKCNHIEIKELKKFPFCTRMKILHGQVDGYALCGITGSNSKAKKDII